MRNENDSVERLGVEIRERISAEGPLRFDHFIAMALYHPEHGYYRKAERKRVAKTGQHDFTTASQLGEVWNRLIRSALVELLKPENPNEYTLVEMGTEPEGSPLLRAGAAPFASVESRSLGDTRTLPPKSVIFFNEVLDAQPFRRVRFTPGGWREGYVDWSAEKNSMEWRWLEPTPEVSEKVESISPPLPGQIIDLPLKACTWLKELLNQPWEGVLLTCDYGKTWHELVHEFPEGTGRAFFQQQVHGDLLAQPGNQDLTCDVCWDWLEETLRDNGATAIGRERLEAFWMRWARTSLEELFTHGDITQRSVLRELLHPRYYGMRFEALYAKKSSVAPSPQSVK